MHPLLDNPNPTHQHRNGVLTMARVARNQGSDDYLHQSPPAELLPPPIAALLTELRDVTTRRDEAASRRSNLRVTAHEDDAHARRLDAEAAAHAAREGRDVTGTPNLDELHKQRAQAEHDAAALADAADNVRFELLNAMTAYRESGDVDTALEAARTKLDKAAVPFRKALTEAAQTRGVADWLNGQLYDQSAKFHILDLAPAARGAIGPTALDLPPVDAFATLDTLTTITD